MKNESVLSKKKIEEMAETSYKYGFKTDIESETAPKGLSEEVIRMISKKKNHFSHFRSG